MAYTKEEITITRESVECDWCHAKLISDDRRSVSVTAGNAGWDWYCGTESKVFHICQKCKKVPARKQEFIARIEAAGGVYRE